MSRKVIQKQFKMKEALKFRAEIIKLVMNRLEYKLPLFVVV